VKEKAGAGAEFLYLDKYLERAGLLTRRSNRGFDLRPCGVQRGKSDFDPLGATGDGSDTVGGAFRQAIKDKEVKAILFVSTRPAVLRCFDTIWQER